VVDAALAVAQPERGIEIVEMIRGLRFGEQAMSVHHLLALARDTAPVVVSTYEFHLRRLQVAEATISPVVEGVSAEVRRLRLAVADATANLRSLPGLSEFGLSPSIASIRNGISKGKALVYIVEVDWGLVALVLFGHDDVVVVRCPLSKQSVTRWVEVGVALPFGQERAKLLGSTFGELGPRSFDAALDRELRATAPELAAKVLSPILAAVPQGMEDLELIACGRLGAIPFHIASDSESAIVDRVPISYCLTGVQSDERQSRPDGPPIPIVGDTRGLAWADCESFAVAALYGERTVVVTSADAFHHELDSFDSFHFVGHADVEFDPLKTFLSVAADGATFTVRDVEDIVPRSRNEAFISACSARTPSFVVPDEMIGFPSALIAKGFRRVVSAPWPIADRVAAISSVRYHERRVMFRSEAPSRSLAEVQRWLRVVTNDEVCEWAQSLADRMAAAEVPVPELRLLSLQYRSDPMNERPFADPGHWGALAMTGH
jgi:CHAT domain-containing protein